MPRAKSGARPRRVPSYRACTPGTDGLVPRLSLAQLAIIQRIAVAPVVLQWRRGGGIRALGVGHLPILPMQSVRALADMGLLAVDARKRVRLHVIAEALISPPALPFERLRWAALIELNSEAIGLSGSFSLRRARETVTPDSIHQRMRTIAARGRVREAA